jgi:FixJ family two-component response regulator
MSDGDFTVFIVDDDPGVLRALARLLAAASYRTRSFASPEAFLSQHDPAEPGCAVFDVAMPDVDGLELQRLLYDSGIERPIIFVTGQGDIPTSVRAMRAGAVDFLTKPVSSEALLAAVTRKSGRPATRRHRSRPASPG